MSLAGHSEVQAEQRLASLLWMTLGLSLKDRG